MSAGVGAVLKAPIGGAFLAIEAIFFNNHWKDKSILLRGIAFSLITSLGAYLTVGVLTGFSPILYIETEAPNWISIYPLWALLGGVIGGLTAKAYILFFQVIKRKIIKTSLPLWLQPLFGVLLASGVVILLSTGQTTALQPFEIGRPGLAPLQDALLGKLGLQIVLMMILGKTLDVSIRSGTGNSVGIFGPVMWVGGLAGALIGFLPNCKYSAVPIVSGIASSIATAMRFPLAGSIIVIEIFNPTWIVPSILGSVIGVLINHILKVGFNTEKSKREV
jgi:CIC family chloride channel protein